MTYDAAVPADPVRFKPDMEQPDPDEAQTVDGLIETLTGIAKTTFEHSGHATRGVHAKSHGVLTGELEVLSGLPPVLAQGLFARPARYPVMMRLSTIPGDILDDWISTPRGLAIKVLGVDGPRLAGSEEDHTQDFVLANAPAFSAPNAKKFLGSLKMVAKTTDRLDGVKHAVSALAGVTERVLEAFGTKSPTVVTLGGQPRTHILGESFYSQAPLLYGPYIAKLAVVPVSPHLVALTDAALDMSGHPNALREAVVAYFRRHAAEWEIRVQLCTDLDTMPIEDAAVVWPEDQSPYITVARLSAPMQDAWQESKIEAIDDGMAFSPWHGLAAHRPLGSIMRARQSTYQSSARFRATRNGCPIGEPRQAALPTEEETLDDALAESFPASDPPATSVPHKSVGIV
jgi:hypothetical protein